MYMGPNAHVTLVMYNCIKIIIIIENNIKAENLLFFSIEILIKCVDFFLHFKKFTSNELILFLHFNNMCAFYDKMC